MYNLQATCTPLNFKMLFFLFFFIVLNIENIVYHIKCSFCLVPVLDSVKNIWKTKLFLSLKLIHKKKNSYFYKNEKK